MSKPRVRFAPSPTGFLHIGGIRSALFNVLFARAHSGTFVLRLEDTDRERYVPEAEQHLLESLAWLGLSPDEGFGAEKGDKGPYIQSERLDIYREQSAILVESGALYPCWCTPERLDGLRKAAQEAKKPFKYDRHCLSHPGELDKPHVLRFRIPDNAVVSWQDAVKGDIEFHGADLDDFVAVKSDGYPTYQFANVVDDHLMQISHVLRADEWIPSTPKHILIYQAFGWEQPTFAHLPGVLAPGGGKKLSKRHGAKSALELRDEGYLPEAVVNFLALLGWNPGEGSTKEIFSMDELISAFSLEHVQTSPATFDAERLLWLNGVHIRGLPVEELLRRCQSFWPHGAEDFDDIYRQKALELVQERLKTLGELSELTDFFFSDPSYQDVAFPAEAKGYLEAASRVLTEASAWTHAEIEANLRRLAEELGAKTGELFKPIRLAITGKTASPGLFETMVVVGRDISLKRLEKASKSL